MSFKKILSGMLLGLVGMASAQATVMSYDIEIKFNFPEGLYAAGDVIRIEASWDDAGTEFHHYSDGANGLAELGAGDDTVLDTTSLYPGLNFLSDIELQSITGLKYAGDAQNYHTENWARAYEIDNGIRDDLYIEIQLDSFSVWLYLTDAYQYAQIDTFGTIPDRFGLTRRQAACTADLSFMPSCVSMTPQGQSSVPEPSALLLVGLGLAGLGFSVRKTKLN